MSEISKERAQEIFLGNGPEPTVQEERALARIALDWLALREILDGVPQEAIDGGWTARGLSDYAKQLETELAALRERAEPVVCQKCGNTGLADSGGVQPWGEPILIECDCTAPPAPVVPDAIPETESKDGNDIDYMEPSAIYELGKTHGWNACRAVMLNQARSVAETDITSQQFESLEGKAVSGSEGFECTPVADLYELLTKCGECYDYTTSAKVAADWIKEGYSAREYVKLDRLQEAMTQGSPGEADGWIPCSERMPDDGVSVLAYCKCGDNFSGIYTMRAPVIRSKNSRKDDSVVHHERVTHWMPLPAAPGKEG
ncbi:DUF551 domain-containing protein [Cronobacter sakazakii]